MFFYKRKLFDKLLRSTERKYNRQKAYQIEQINTSNPTEFWKQISSLGPKKNTEIPLKVYNANGDIVNEHNTVLESWKNDFSGLYNIPEGTNTCFDNEFYHNLKTELDNIKDFELGNIIANTENYNLELEKCNE